MGALDVSDEAEVVSASAIIGQQFGSIGAVTVTDPGSFWSINGSLDVGLVGQGSMTITNGGTVFTDGFVTLGTFPEVDIPPKDGGIGDVTVTGPASFWFIGGDLHVGFMWLGTLSVLDGAAVTSDNSFVGSMFGGMGEAIVQGSNSVWSNSGDLNVASTLTVADGGVVVADAVFIETNDPLVPLATHPVALRVTDAPVIAVDPPRLDFGTVFIGTSRTLNLAIINAGTEALTISDVTVGDPGVSDRAPANMRRHRPARQNADAEAGGNQLDDGLGQLDVDVAPGMSK